MISLLNVYRSFLDRFFILLTYLSMLILIVLVAIVLGGVFFRYVLSNSLSWSGEVSRYLCIWMSFIGSAILRDRRGHIALEIIAKRFPTSWKNWVFFTNEFLLLIFLGFVAYYGTQLAILQADQRSSALLMPMTIPYASVPVGAVLMAMPTIYFVFYFLRKAIRKEFV